MGVLLGGFGKLAAGSRLRDIQARLMRVQVRLRRATRDVADMQKSLDRQKKNELNSLTAYINNIKQGSQAALLANPDLQGIIAKMGGMNGTNTEALSDAERLMLTQYQQGMTNAGTNIEQYEAMMKTEIENKYEYLNDIQLDPLKDEEDSLQLEKDTLESQKDLASNDYKACQDMEKKDQEMFKPNYTAGG